MKEARKIPATYMEALMKKFKTEVLFSFIHGASTSKELFMVLNRA